jgi:hypothetical protein
VKLMNGQEKDMEAHAVASVPSFIKNAVQTIEAMGGEVLEYTVARHNGAEQKETKQ